MPLPCPPGRRKIVFMQTNSPADAASAVELAQVRARFGQLIGAVYRRWRRQIDSGFKQLGLSDASRMPLITLYAHDAPMQQKDLAQALHLESCSLVRVLAQLRQAQLVDWHCDPGDRRTKYITLTAQGRATATRILQQSLQIEQAILADVTAQELEVTRRTLQKISQRFDTL
jgi:MarR family transcriptional regulator for hemolysin